MNPSQSKPSLRSIPTRDCLKSVYEHSVKFCQDVLTQTDAIQPQVIFFTSAPGASTPSEMAMMDGKSAGRFFEDADTKAKLMAFLNAVFDPSSPSHAQVKAALGFTPNLVAVVSEAWITEAALSSPPEKKSRVSSKDIQAAIDALGGLPVRDMPSRKEAVIIQMHSDAGTIVGICPMERDQNGKASITMTPFEHFEQQKLGGAMSLNPDPDDEISQSLAKVMRP